MNSVSSNRVVIFSKSADLDSVKTRLRPQLSNDQCLSLHLSLLKDTLEKVNHLSPVLYLAGSGYLPFESPVPVRFQKGEDLGARMRNAFLEELTSFNKVVIIGTDAPTVPPEEIHRAFEMLDHKDVILGPSEDGGYYLIGLKELKQDLFDDIEWGTDTVLARTLERLTSAQYALLATYFDIDLPEDLIRLGLDLKNRSELKLSHLREWFSAYADGCDSATWQATQ